MELTTSLPLYTLLVVAVGACRLAELAVSQRRRRALLSGGARPVAEPRFAAMVLLHTGVLASACAEAWLARRQLQPLLAGSMLGLFAAATALRLWVIATLGPHWNVRVISSLELGVVVDGPFRWIRHPNYLAVFVELAALPLIHGAYLTATVGTALHAWVMWHRIHLEESMLLANPTYRALMAAKPRFLPW